MSRVIDARARSRFALERVVDGLSHVLDALQPAFDRRQRTSNALQRVIAVP
jgi:hypothetical protein